MERIVASRKEFTKHGSTIGFRFRVSGVR